MSTRIKLLSRHHHHVHRRHHHLIRRPPQNHHQQRHQLRHRRLGPFLRKPGHPAGPSVHCPPAVKRPGGASKRPHLVRHQALTGRVTGALGRLLDRGAVGRPLEPSDHSQQINRLHAFLLVYGTEAIIPRISSSTCLASPCTQRQKQRKRKKTASICWKRPDCWHSSGPPSTSRACAATTTRRSSHMHSTKATLCCT